MVVQIEQKQIAREQIARKQFMVAEYARMHEAGIFAEDERIELIGVDIYTMNAVSPMHAAIVKRLDARWCVLRAAWRVLRAACCIVAYLFFEVHASYVIQRDLSRFAFQTPNSFGGCG